MNVTPASGAVAASNQQQPASNPELAAERRVLARATKTINDSGMLGGQNELVFAMDRTTQRPVMRLVDRTTQQVVMQIPPEYILELAETLNHK